MKEVRYELPALTELFDAAEWYESKRVGLGEEFIAEMDRLQETIAERPASYPRLQETSSSKPIRRALSFRFSYGLIFVELEKEIRIVAVAHTKREPNYWQNRLWRYD